MATITLTLKDIGTFDKASRFVISEKYQTDSSLNIRAPSRAFPFSMYKHALTKKYAKQLAVKLSVDSVIITK